MELRNNRRKEFQDSPFKQDGDLSPEFTLEERLVIQMSRLVLVPKVLRLVEDMTRDYVDWGIFLDVANNHRMSGLIFHHYESNKLCLPSGVVQALSEQALRNHEQANSVFRDLYIISRALADIDYHVLVMKGPVLSHEVYRSRSIRQINDIDLLVSYDNVSKVGELLYGLGYVYAQLDYETRRMIPLEQSEIDRPWPGSLHMPVLCKRSETGIYIKPKIDLHVSNLRLGNFGYDHVIDRSRLQMALGPGLRVPSPEDHIILLAYHFYIHYRLPPLADVSFSRGGLSRQPGVLKFLSDIYASMLVFLSSSDDWCLLLERANHIGAREILTYGLFFVDFVYGKGTVPSDVLDGLLNQREMCVPIMGNDMVQVDAIGRLLDYEIKTHASTIGPVHRMFHPEKVPGMLIGALRDWKAQGYDIQSGRCMRVERLSADGMPVDGQWSFADELSLDETQVGPGQFFTTHITGGVWPFRGGVRGYLRPLWNDRNLFLQADVYADRFHYVPREYFGYGEAVNIYISNPQDKDVTYKIGITIGQGDEIAPEPPPAVERPYKTVKLECLRVRVCTTNHRYLLQMRIPWKVLNITPVSGLQLRFDVEIIHLSAEMTLKTAIAWAGGRFLSEAYPELYGDLILVA